MQYYRMNPRYKKTSSGQTMTVILDLTNSDPTQWATYADDAVGMTAGSDAWDDFFGHYPCILENGVELGKLKRDNFGQYEDGTTAPITTLGKDVMICFPRRGIKIEYLDANTLSVSMTNEDNKEGYSYWAHSYSNSSASLTNAVCDKFYLGAYKGYYSVSRLYSTSGKTPTTDKYLSNFRAYARSNGIGYEQSGFFQLTFRQVMYLLKYKGQDAQIAIGRGYVDGNTGSHITGGTNTRGMDWGESTGKEQMKLFGLEDFYGNIWEFIDGLYSDANRKLYVADGNFNNTGTNYTDANTSAFSTNISGDGLRYPAGTNLAGFNGGSQIYGNTSTYFCDGTYVAAYKLANFGGYWNDTSYAGVFELYMARTAAESNIYVGSRLMYMHVAS